MKTEAGDVPLIAVGGGAFLVPDKLPGVSQVIHVAHGDCANAVGAAIAQVSGECDQIFQDMTRADAIAAAQGIANDRAVAAGADAQDAQHHRERRHAARLPAGQLRAGARARGGRRGRQLERLSLGEKSVLAAFVTPAQRPPGTTLKKCIDIYIYTYRIR